MQILITCQLTDLEEDRNRGAMLSKGFLVKNRGTFSTYEILFN